MESVPPGDLFDPADRLRRFPLVFVEDLGQPVLERADVDHLTRSRRLGVGAQVNVGDGLGRWRPATLRTVDGEVECGSVITAPSIGRGHCVGFTPTKGVRVEGLVQKLTELGVAQMVVLRSERSVITYDTQRAERLLRKLTVTIREACQQSRQTVIPSVEGVLSLEQFLASRTDVALCDPDGPPLLNREIPAQVSLSVAVGPEGGWSERERKLAPAFSLPGRILRSDTAVLAAGVALAALGDRTD